MERDQLQPYSNCRRSTWLHDSWFHGTSQQPPFQFDYQEKLFRSPQQNFFRTLRYSRCLHWLEKRKPDGACVQLLRQNLASRYNWYLHTRLRQLLCCHHLPRLGEWKVFRNPSKLSWKQSSVTFPWSPTFPTWVKTKENKKGYQEIRKSKVKINFLRDYEENTKSDKSHLKP